jgi:hypothetical protein
MNFYTYHTARGLAVLNKGDGAPLLKLGKFKDEAAARVACETHYAKACKALTNLGKPAPQKFYA